MRRFSKIEFDTSVTDGWLSYFNRVYSELNCKNKYAVIYRIKSTLHGRYRFLQVIYLGNECLCMYHINFHAIKNSTMTLLILST